MSERGWHSNQRGDSARDAVSVVRAHEGLVLGLLRDASKVKSNRWRAKREAAGRAAGRERNLPGSIHKHTHTSCLRCDRAAPPSPNPTGTASTRRPLYLKASWFSSPVKVFLRFVCSAHSCRLVNHVPDPSQRRPAPSAARLPNINRSSLAPPETFNKLPSRRAEYRRPIRGRIRRA